MLRFLLKLLFLLWLSLVLCLGIALGLGKIAPSSSKVAFFSQYFDGTDYWRLDLFTGVSFKDEYSGRIFIPEIVDAPIQHFLAVSGDANYYTVSEVNLYSQALRYVAKYPSRSYSLLLAGDYIFTFDTASQWRRIHIPSSDLDYFGRYPNLSNPQVSPDGQWMAGRIYTGNLMLINVFTGNTYELSGYCCVIWSPNSRWMLAKAANNQQIVTVLRVADGSVHPRLSQSFQANSARWTSNSQSILFQADNHLASISLQTGAITEYPARAENFWITCFAPNQVYILSRENLRISLLDVQTGAELWHLERYISNLSNCFWSADSRYLSFYAQSQELDALGNWRIAWERFIFLDTQSHQSRELYPANLPSAPLYLHIPD